jgi:hypothetical protein
LHKIFCIFTLLYNQYGFNMRRIGKYIFILLLISPLFAEFEFIFSEYSAVAENNRVTVTWVTKAENDVRQFVILRSRDDRNFVELKRINVQGPGTFYTYVDENVMFKDVTRMFYKIQAIDQNNKVKEESHSLIAHPNVSGIFRTWGAIKALFR